MICGGTQQQRLVRRLQWQLIIPCARTSDCRSRFKENAVDAAIASSLCLSVANPFASGIGGGGVMVIRLANGTTAVIDYREMAPSAARVNMFVNNTNLSKKGALSIGVPGELKGLEYASKKYGKLAWKKLVQPAMDLAQNGCPVYPLLASVLSASPERILNSPRLAAIFAPEGTLLQEGDHFIGLLWATSWAKLRTMGRQCCTVLVRLWLPQSLPRSKLLVALSLLLTSQTTWSRKEHL